MGNFGEYSSSTKVFFSELKWTKFDIKQNRNANFLLSMDTPSVGPNISVAYASRMSTWEVWDSYNDIARLTSAAA